MHKRACARTYQSEKTANSRDGVHCIGYVAATNFQLRNFDDEKTKAKVMVIAGAYPTRSTTIVIQNKVLKQILHLNYLERDLPYEGDKMTSR